METRRAIPLDVIKDGLNVLDDKNVVRVGEKTHGAYMFACNISLQQHGKVTLISRGRYNSKTIDILESLKHQIAKLEATFTTRTEETKSSPVRRVSVLQIDIKKK